MADVVVADRCRDNSRLQVFVLLVLRAAGPINGGRVVQLNHFFCLEGASGPTTPSRNKTTARFLYHQTLCGVGGNLPRFKVTSLSSIFIIFLLEHKQIVCNNGDSPWMYPNCSPALLDAHSREDLHMNFFLNNRHTDSGLGVHLEHAQPPA